MKSYVINWHKNEKYGVEIDRNTRIQASDPKTATSVFMQEFGNLKKNTINYIQEVDSQTDERIGEPIIPKDEINQIDDISKEKTK